MPETKKFDFVILYVNDVALSTTFYQDMLGAKPEMEMEGFAMFVTENGQHFGLQARDTAPPAPHLNGIAGGGTELGLQLAGDADVNDLHAAWVDRGIDIVETPNAKPFGYTVMAADPDGHRIRAYAPAAQS